MARPPGTRDPVPSGGVADPINELPNIAALIEDGGQISIGGIYPIACAAVANDDHNTYAMLQRRQGESLHALLMRLDAAIGTAWEWEDGNFIDEINTASPVKSPFRKSRRR